MTRHTRRFTKTNHSKSCRLRVARFHKLGWQETHTFHKKVLKNSAAPIIIIVDSIATGLRRYRYIWKNCFKDAINLGISGDRVENVWWRAWDISLQQTTLFVILHCGASNLYQSKTRYCRRSHEKCWDLYEELTKNNYHHYWYVTKEQGILFSTG